MSKDNIAIGAILQHKPTKSPIFVGNAHLHWDPQFKDVKVVQAAMLVHEIAKFVDVPDQKRMPILLGGDFNSEPDSGVFKLISEGRVAIDHPDLVNREYAKFAEEVRPLIFRPLPPVLVCALLRAFLLARYRGCHNSQCGAKSARRRWASTTISSSAAATTASSLTRTTLQTSRGLLTTSFIRLTGWHLLRCSAQFRKK